MVQVILGLKVKLRPLDWFLISFYFFLDFLPQRKPFSVLSELDGESNVLNHCFGVDLH